MSFLRLQQQQIRTQLSFVLEGVLAQQLLPKAGGPGRVLAMEVMIPNPAIRNLIREDKIQQIYSLMQVGQARFGMQTMNQALLSLYERHLITLEDALERSLIPMNFGRCYPPPAQRAGDLQSKLDGRSKGPVISGS